MIIIKDTIVERRDPMYFGKQSFSFANKIYINATNSIVGTKEGEGPLKNYFDEILKDDLAGCTNWEEAESYLQKKAVEKTISSAQLTTKDIQLLFSGDLLGQSIASSYGTATIPIPHVGVYGACSTCSLTLILGAMSVAGGFAQKVICVTSSHFASAEKEFRFPLSYGNQRPDASTWTVTGSAAFLLSCSKSAKSYCKITGATLGIIEDYGVKDAMNMGAAMAPACASTIATHLSDYHSQVSDYDRIITGDLGSVGQALLFDLLEKQHINISANHMDCGMEIFQADTQNTHAGGSGCACSAVTLSAYILKKLQSGEWKKVLFVPTGALLSKTSFEEGMTIPGIAHAIVLEAL